MIRVLIVLVSNFMASGAIAGWCSTAIIGLPETSDLYVEAKLGIPHVYARNRNQLYELRDIEFFPVNDTPINPGNYNYTVHPQLSSDGNYTYAAFEITPSGERRGFFYSVSPDGETTRLFEITSNRNTLAVHKDPETNRIFAVTRKADAATVLQEWIGDEFVTSPLWVEGSWHQSNSTPNFTTYVPPLSAWVGLKDEALWILGESDTQWRHVDRVKTWRNEVHGPIRTLHDESRDLAILHIDLAVFVFDVSGPNPEYIYQRMIRRSAISQAGRGGVLIEPLDTREDLGWLETAPYTRVLTKDGARPVRGAGIVYRGKRFSIGKETFARNDMINMGDSVLILHAHGIALFDGEVLIDRPDLAAELSGRSPFPIRTRSNRYLQGETEGMYRWNEEGGLEAVSGPEGERVKYIFSGKDFEFFRYGTFGGIRDQFQNLFDLNAPTDAGKFIGYVDFQHRTALLARFELDYFLYEPCEDE